MATEKESSPGHYSAGFFSTPLDRLMPREVRRVLLVASLYDYFILEEDGRLLDLLGQAYKNRDLGYVPHLSRVTGGGPALELLRRESFDLVVTMMRLGDLDPFTFGRLAREIVPGLPVVVLAYNTPELQRLLAAREESGEVDGVFVWQGDGKILVGIIEYVEDMLNTAHDSALFGVGSILLVEDSPAFYSRYLPLIYAELWSQTENLLLQEGLSRRERQTRQRARPKVLLASSYEEGWRLFRELSPHLLGLVTDISFPREGREDPRAGLDLAAAVRRLDPHLPVLLQTSTPGVEQEAGRLNLFYVDKNSPRLELEFRRFLQERLGFAALQVTGGAGAEGRSLANLSALHAEAEFLDPAALAGLIADGSLCRWLKARTEVELAAGLAGISDPELAEQELPRRLKSLLAAQRRDSHRGSVVPYSRHFYDDYAQFSRIGTGSIGGKGRGLAFIDRVLVESLRSDPFPGVNISVPRTLVLATDVFEEFMEENKLLETALAGDSDERLAAAFIAADLPPTILGDLRDFIDHIKAPLAVRSSSLLEDSLYQPFAGIYATKMLPNDQAAADIRFLNLANAVKFVFASTFFRNARSYLRHTPYRSGDERMAVLIQEIVGRRHHDRFYPDFSGVARTFNYYPVADARPEDGVVNLALGLGKTVVDGGVSLRYTPRFPGVFPQFGNVRDMLKNSQREFYAIVMKQLHSLAFTEEEQYLVRLDLESAELDGVLDLLASTYSPENEAVYDGLRPGGPRILTFAHIIKQEVFPLSRILDFLMETGSQAMGCPVEIEFAVNLNGPRALPAFFGFLQIRPLVVGDELVRVEVPDRSDPTLLMFSEKVLGNGVYRLHDLVFVKPDQFNAAHTPAIAREVEKINNRLQDEGREYLLIGPGRWGSTDSWLGVPVSWSQISSARVIVEVALPQLNVDPSQGSHFFQNMTSLRIGYFTLPYSESGAGLDWDWLTAQPALSDGSFVRHLRFDSPLEIHMDGRSGRGMVKKTGAEG